MPISLGCDELDLIFTILSEVDQKRRPSLYLPPHLDERPCLSQVSHATLIACSCVCRTWRALVFPRLMEYLVISPTSHLLQGGREPSFDVITRRTKSVTLHGGIVDMAILDQLKDLENLQYLQVENIAPSPDMMSPKLIIPKLIAFHFYFQNAAYSFGTLSQILLCMPNLTRLSFNGWFKSSPSIDHLPSEYPSFSLSHLAVVHEGFNDYEWVLARSTRSLQTLELMFFTQPSPALSSTIRTFGPNLTKLALSDAFIDPSLLHFHGPNLSVLAIGQLFLAWEYDTFMSYIPESIRCLHIVRGSKSLLVGSPLEVALICCEALSKTIRTQRWKLRNLEELVVDLNGVLFTKEHDRTGMEDAKQKVYAMLQVPCSSRGIVLRVPNIVEG